MSITTMWPLAVSILVGFATFLVIVLAAMVFAESIVARARARTRKDVSRVMNSTTYTTYGDVCSKHVVSHL